jgi:hypothetical protein
VRRPIGVLPGQFAALGKRELPRCTERAPKGAPEVAELLGYRPAKPVVNRFEQGIRSGEQDAGEVLTNGPGLRQPPSSRSATADLALRPDFLLRRPRRLGFF